MGQQKDTYSVHVFRPAMFYLMYPENSKFCYYVWVLYNTLGLIFCGVSLLTLTVISIERLLALMLRSRYSHVVTLKATMASYC